MLTIIAFIVALGVLIAIHEYGHYRVAVACGVKVLRFSIGMGKPLVKWRGRGGETEFVIAALPVGGYVRMLDERERAVEPAEAHRAFNRQALWKRAAIVVAGPVANLLLAIVLYGAVAWMGQEQPQAIISAPEAGTLAAQAGLKGGEQIDAVQGSNGEQVAISSFEDLRWQLTQSAMNGQDIVLIWSSGNDLVHGQSKLPLSVLAEQGLDQTVLKHIGIEAPWTPPVVGEVIAGLPAQLAGLQSGDMVRAVDQQSVSDGAQLRALIRESKRDALTQQWFVERDGQTLALSVTPEFVETPDGVVAKVGAYIGGAPAMVMVQKDLPAALIAGMQKTWDVSILSLQMMGKMLIGQASLSNLSGPLTIADYAGKSASMGWVPYILFVALISVSLGVLNLLPLPVLDGGHLMYYLWEVITGHAVSDVWMERLQRLGIGMLLLMMSIALFNDFSRLWG